MFDVFYIGKKPNVFAHERAVESVEQAQQQSCTRFFWMITYLADYTGFDFLWEPVPWQSHQRHAWASQWQKDSGTYLVPKLGYQDTNYHTSPIITRIADSKSWSLPESLIEEFDYSWHPDPADPPMTYQFGTQHQRTGGPIYFNGSDTIKYVDQPRAFKISVDQFWEIPDGVDIAEFDWSWHPDSTDNTYIYQFGTQHQRTGGPRYVVPGASQVKYIDQIRIKTQRTAAATYVIDHMDGHAQALQQQLSADRVVRYFDNYLDTLRRISKTAHDLGQEFIWITSSICDYTNFDFTWHPEQWQASMLHVFSSDGEKFGDTFFMHVPTFQYRSETCQLLEWYDVNFVEGIDVPRNPMPMIQHRYDNQVDAIKNSSWAGPLALFTNYNWTDSFKVTVPLWREKTKTVVPLDAAGAVTIVPRAAVPYIKTQIYDYPYIDKTHRFLKSPLLDIVFIDNGEHGAEYHWQILNQVAQGHGRIHRVTGVNGRVAAYQAAARISETDWFFAVFAKLQVNEDFDWTWQPDRLQEAKHYIFHAYNPVNNLVYGHQAMIAYNRRLVLENTGQGLDFTLDQAHEVVPIVSGTAYYDNDPWTCWRTAFRETLKLRHSLPDVENEYRLQQWLFIGQGTNGHWSTTGADDAVKYYEEVNGDFEELKKSYEWAWLASYAMLKHPQLFTQSNT